MLQKLFRVSGSIYMRVLFGVLLVAFVIFGIGDVFRSRGISSGDVATVGDQHITPDQLNKAMEQNVKQFAGRIDVAMLRKLGYQAHVLDAMIDNILMESAARDAGFAIGNRQAVEEIEKIPVFQDDKTKKLDRERFERVLAANQINEAEFVSYLKRETATKLLSDSELSPLPVPPLLLDVTYRFQNETRRGEILQIDNAAMIVAPPTDDQLAEFYHKHEAAFTAPEYRDFSYLYLDLGSFADKVTVSPDELKQAYDTRQADFKVPARRALSQIVLKDEAAANAVFEAAKGGKSLDAAAKASGVSDKPMELGLMSRQDLPEILQEPIFSAASGTVLKPIQTPLGWHVIMVERVEPEHALSFDEAKDALEADLKAEKARDIVATTAKQIDDQLAGGATLAEAGKPFGLTPVTIKAVDAQGKHPDGSLAPEVKPHVEILKAAFAAEKDAPGQIKPDGKDADYAIVVEGITPPALRPLADVKTKVADGYMAEAKSQAATAKAADLTAKAKAGAAFDALAKEADASVTPIGPILRSVNDKSLSPHVVTTLFNLTQIGDVGQADTPTGPALVHLTEIIPPAPQSADDKAVLEKTLQKQMQADLTTQYEKALRTLYPVKIDQAMLDKMKGP